MRAAITLAASILLSAPAAAPAQSPQPTPPAPHPSTAVEWADQPLRLDFVGLTMRLPLGSRTQSTEIGDATNVQVLPADTAWLMNIRTSTTDNPASSTADALNQVISLIQGSFGVTDPEQKSVLSTTARVFDRTDSLRIGPISAARAYISTPRGDGSSFVRGYTIFKPMPRHFVIFELIVPEEGLPAARRIYETTVATAAFADPAEIMASRGAAIRHGVELLDSLTPDLMDEILKRPDAWHRLYSPAPTGDPKDASELGYRVLKFWRGKRGEVNPDIPTSRWKPADSQDGFLCELSVRLLDNPGYIDTRARYFLSADRKEEAWSVQMVMRDDRGKERGGEGRARWTESGARSAADVQVVVAEPGKPSRPIVPFIQGEGYVSQFDTFILPDLIARSAATATDRATEKHFAFYTYRSSTESISLRRDTLTRDPEGIATWIVETTFREDLEPQKTYFTDTGTFLRSHLADGRVWEPTDPTTLIRLWKSKGLPTDR